jgi:DedD protein
LDDVTRMGLFSHLKKDKQGPGEAEGAYVARSEDAGVRSRAKRGSGKTANEPVDPVLPEKKRARRRLVGAIALALAVIIGLPMVLDSEPKPLSGDIAIQIPSKDKPYSASDATARPRSSVPAEQALDQGEEIVNLPGNAAVVSASARTNVAAPATPVADKPVAAKPAEVKPAEAKPAKPAEATSAEPKPTKPAEATSAEPKPTKPAEPKPTEHKPVEPKPTKPAEAKPIEPKPTRPVEAKPVEPMPTRPAEAKSAEPKPVPNPEGAVAPRQDSDNAERAKALLEGKPEAKPTRFVVQVAALATQEKIDELQDKLRAAGITSHTQKVATDSGPRTRIRVGPFADKDEANRMRDKLIKLGLNGTLIPQ